MEHIKRWVGPAWPFSGLCSALCFGLDIAAAEAEVTIRVPSDATPGRRQQESRTFGTTGAELLSLADWLRCWGVTKLGMEATGDYVRREGA